jgi:hypothetical protein
MTITNMLDQFYTADHEVIKCLDAWASAVKIKDDDVVLEPSAGQGAFSNKIKGCIAYDLEPKGEGIIQQDFLTLDLTEYGDKNIHFIGNPPFGKQSSLAFKFIKKMTSYKNTKSFALIIPVSHARPHYKNKINPYFHIIHEHYVNDFVELGKSKKVKCIFQIWIRKDERRELYNMNPKTNLVSIIPYTSSDEFDFKIGSKKCPGIVFNKDYTYDQESDGSFMRIKIHDDDIYHELCEWVGEPLFQVKREDFIAAPNITRAELINSLEEIYTLYHQYD